MTLSLTPYIIGGSSFQDNKNQSQKKMEEKTHYLVSISENLHVSSSFQTVAYENSVSASCIFILSVSLPPHSLWIWEKQFSLKIFCDTHDSQLFIHVHIISGTKIVQKAHLLKNLWICPQKRFSLLLVRVGNDLKANQDTRSLLSSVPLCKVTLFHNEKRRAEKKHTQLTEVIVTVLHTCSRLLLSFGEGVKSLLSSLFANMENQIAAFSVP